MLQFNVIVSWINVQSALWFTSQRRNDPLWIFPTRGQHLSHESKKPSKFLKNNLTLHVALMWALLWFDSFPPIRHTWKASDLCGGSGEFSFSRMPLNAYWADSFRNFSRVVLQRFLGFAENNSSTSESKKGFHDQIWYEFLCSMEMGGLVGLR